ncbi:MAG: hypothetical protein RR548_05150 [Carnobacterium sp.]|uniref:hypothetical protein n=1 Tax=Carnobacterium sp. TaxID=48221 RepID=UPI002FC88084
MKKTTGTILLMISNILSTGTLIVISYGLVRLSTIEIAGAPPSYTEAIQIIFIALMFEAVKWFSFYQVVYKNKTFYLVPYLLLSILLATAGFRQLLALLLGILYFISTVLLFFATKDIQTKSEPLLTDNSETGKTLKTRLEKTGFFLLTAATIYNGIGLVHSLVTMEPYLRNKPTVLVQVILIPLMVMLVSFYALVKLWENRYSLWKYLFLVLAISYGFSSLKLWFIGKQAGISFMAFDSNPIAIFIATQAMLVGIYLIGFTLLTREARRK